MAFFDLLTLSLIFLNSSFHLRCMKVFPFHFCGYKKLPLRDLINFFPLIFIFGSYCYQFAVSFPCVILELAAKLDVGY